MTAIPPLLVLKGVFAKFQNAELASAEVAIPTSPIPPLRASGDILKKGTAVVTTLMVFACCAFKTWVAPNINKEAVNLMVACFMLFIAVYVNFLSISLEFLLLKSCKCKGFCLKQQL